MKARASAVPPRGGLAVPRSTRGRPTLATSLVGAVVSCQAHCEERRSSGLRCRTRRRCPRTRALRPCEVPPGVFIQGRAGAQFRASTVPSEHGVEDAPMTTQRNPSRARRRHSIGVPGETRATIRSARTPGVQRRFAGRARGVNDIAARDDVPLTQLEQDDDVLACADQRLRRSLTDSASRDPTRGVLLEHLRPQVQSAAGRLGRQPLSGMSASTTVLSGTTARFPMRTPGITVTPEPSKTSSPIIVP